MQQRGFAGTGVPLAPTDQTLISPSVNANEPLTPHEACGVRVNLYDY